MTSARRVLVCLGAIVCFAAAARAELIIFSDGRVVKAASFKVIGAEVQIELPGGGGFAVVLDRVERIIDDEVAVEIARVSPLAAPDASYHLSFRADRKRLFHTAFDSLI